MPSPREIGLGIGGIHSVVNVENRIQTRTHQAIQIHTVVR
jgi:hypothetical protein